MKQLKSVVRYECATSFKYIWIFYAIQYACISLIILLIGLSQGTFENVGTSALEMNTCIYLVVLGVLGFQEDFKMLIQNGFTRTYIFAATLSMFGFISASMALVDTAAGQLANRFSGSYSSLYGDLYGYDHLFMNWLWLFLLYLALCTLFYFIVLVIHRLGKTAAIFSGVLFGGVVLLAVALFQYVLSPEAADGIQRFLMKAMGFLEDGTIRHLFPVLTLSALAAGFGLGSYAVIRRTQLQ